MSVLDHCPGDIGVRCKPVEVAGMEDSGCTQNLEDLCHALFDELSKSLELSVQAGAMTRGEAKLTGKHYLKDISFTCSEYHLEELCHALFDELSKSLELNVQAGAMTRGQAKLIGKHYMEDISITCSERLPQCLDGSLVCPDSAFTSVVCHDRAD